MVRRKFVSKPVDFKKLKKGRAIPKQSMSLQEIVRRFVKRIPVEVNTSPPVYLDGFANEDLEKVSRLDTADRALRANEVAQRAEALKKEAEAKTSELVSENKRIADEKEAERLERESATGIDSLDNTMPDDSRPQGRRRPLSKDSKSDK